MPKPKPYQATVEDELEEEPQKKSTGSHRSSPAPSQQAQKPSASHSSGPPLPDNVSVDSGYSSQQAKSNVDLDVVDKDLISALQQPKQPQQQPQPRKSAAATSGPARPASSSSRHSASAAAAASSAAHSSGLGRTRSVSAVDKKSAKTASSKKKSSPIATSSSARYPPSSYTQQQQQPAYDSYMAGLGAGASSDVMPGSYPVASADCDDPNCNECRALTAAATAAAARRPPAVSTDWSYNTPYPNAAANPSGSYSLQPSPTYGYTQAQSPGYPAASQSSYYPDYATQPQQTSQVSEGYPASRRPVSYHAGAGYGSLTGQQYGYGGSSFDEYAPLQHAQTQPATSYPYGQRPGPQPQQPPLSQAQAQARQSYFPPAQQQQQVPKAGNTSAFDNLKKMLQEALPSAGQPVRQPVARAEQAARPPPTHYPTGPAAVNRKSGYAEQLLGQQPTRGRRATSPAAPDMRREKALAEREARVRAQEKRLLRERADRERMPPPPPGPVRRVLPSAPVPPARRTSYHEAYYDENESDSFDSEEEEELEADPRYAHPVARVRRDSRPAIVQQDPRQMAAHRRLSSSGYSQSLPRDVKIEGSGRSRRNRMYQYEAAAQNERRMHALQSDAKRHMQRAEVTTGGRMAPEEGFERDFAINRETMRRVGQGAAHDVEQPEGRRPGMGGNRRHSIQSRGADSEVSVESRFSNVKLTSPSGHVIELTNVPHSDLNFIVPALQFGQGGTMTVNGDRREHRYITSGRSGISDASNTSKLKMRDMLPSRGEEQYQSPD